MIPINGYHFTPWLAISSVGSAGPLGGTVTSRATRTGMAKGTIGSSEAVLAEGLWRGEGGRMMIRREREREREM